MHIKEYLGIQNYLVLTSYTAKVGTIILYNSRSSAFYIVTYVLNIYGMLK